MGNSVISFLFAAGAGTWIYTKFMRYTGNNTQNAVIGAVISAILIFIIFDALLSKFVK